MVLVPEFSLLFVGLYGLLGLAILVQLVYAGYYIVALWSHKPAENGHYPPVSVLVAAHNEHDNLVELLPLLLKQHYPQFEVVVINDRSHDDSRFYLGGLQQLYPNLRVVTISSTPPNMSPKKYAITLGIRAAAHNHLLLTDADCRPASPEWIAGMTAGFGTGAELVLGYSPYEKQKSFLNCLIRFETLLTGWQYLGAALRGHAYMGVGRNLAYTKEVFFRNKGFASHIRKLSGDDDLFVAEAAAHAKVAVSIAEQAQAISKPAKTFAQWWQQKRRHLSAGSSYKPAHRARLGLYILSSILFYILSAIILVLPIRSVWLGIFFAIRTLALFGFYHAAGRKLNDRISVLLMPLLDIVYIVLYLCLGISLLFSRKVRWK